MELFNFEKVTIDDTPYGPHYNTDRKMPECVIGGNLCDECWKAQRGLFEARMSMMMLESMRKYGFSIRTPKKEPEQPAVDIVEFEEIKDIAGVLSVYELTLTTTKDDPYEIRQYFNKIIQSKMFGVLAYKACIELQQNGMPHLHAVLWSSKKVLNSNHVKSKIKFPYIFTLKFVRRQENFYKYILKNKNDASIIDYCQRKGIPQIWSSIDEQAIEGVELKPPQN